MAHFFSINTLLGSDLMSEEGYSIGLLTDLIIDKEDGRLTFIIVTVNDYPELEDRFFAIHHSFFRLDSTSGQLVFNPDFAQEGKQDAKPTLPEFYRTTRVGDYRGFQKEILKDLKSGGHRSDNQIR